MVRIRVMRSMPLITVVLGGGVSPVVIQIQASTAFVTIMTEPASMSSRAAGISTLPRTGTRAGADRADRRAAAIIAASITAMVI